MDCTLLGSFVHRISWARILEWVVISFSKRSSQPKDRTRVSYIARQVLYLWATSISISSVAQSWPTLCNPMDCSMPGFPDHHQLPEFAQIMYIELVMPSNHLILCHPLLLLPSIFPSIRVFSSESVLHIRWPKDWSFSFSICPSNKYSGLISFRIDSFDFLAVQGTLKSLVQHHSSKASILWHSAFFLVQLSIHDYWKNHSFD